MKKAWITGIAAVLLLSGGAYGGYAYWNHPYDLPAVNDQLTAAQLDLDFSKEKAAADAARSPGAAEKAPTAPSGVTPENAPFAYAHSRSLLKEDAGNLGQAVAFLKAAVQAAPDNLMYMNELRLEMVQAGQADAFITYLGTREAKPGVRLQMALGYVDMLQDPSLGTASLGQRSIKSMDILDEMLKENPNDWMGHYARGLNNLYWPVGLQKNDRAIQDLAYCVAVAKQHPEMNFAYWPRVYEAYGDALVKGDQTKQGLAVWKDGAKRFPDDDGLKLRTASDETNALAIVKKERGIDSFQRPKPEMTDLSSIWGGRD